MARKGIDHRFGELREIPRPLVSRRNTCQAAQAAPFAQTVKVQKKERAIVNYRTARARAELVADELGFIGAVEKIAGVQRSVAKVVVGRAVPMIRAAARNQIDLTAGAASIFGAITVGD